MSSCRLPQLTAAIELVSEISRQLNERKTEAVAEITSTFEELERALHQRKTALITDLENICSTKQKVGHVPRVHVYGTHTQTQAVERDLPHVSRSLPAHFQPADFMILTFPFLPLPPASVPYLPLT